MPRPEKVQAVADIKERLDGARAVFLAEYAGLSVKEQQDLRRALRDAGSEFKVYKMTLARLAATESGRDEMLDLLVGPTGLTFVTGDAAATAKVLRDFSKDHARLIVKGALVGTELLTPERVEQLAELEPREVLLAKVAGAFKAPMAAMAGLMAAMPRNLASMIKQLADSMPAEEPEPVAAEPEAAPAAEASPEAETSAGEDTAAEAQIEAEDAPAAEASPEAEMSAEEDTATEAQIEAGEAPAAEATSADAEATTDDEAADEAEEE